VIKYDFTCVLCLGHIDNKSKFHLTSVYQIKLGV
jgi:hypothetical protein